MTKEYLLPTTGRLFAPKWSARKHRARHDLGHQHERAESCAPGTARPHSRCARLLVGTLSPAQCPVSSRPALSALSVPLRLPLPCLLLPAALTEDGTSVLGAGVVRLTPWHGRGTGWSLNGAITMTWVAHLNSIETSSLRLASVSPTYDFARHWPACRCLWELERYPQAFGFQPRRRATEKTLSRGSQENMGMEMQRALSSPVRSLLPSFLFDL